ncbi:MAG: DNA adenine methylase [Phycisphaerae bacterium]|nr:DNA adenine methylase [Phycisphaerae bacterium]
MIKYLGSKRTLVGEIVGTIVRSCGGGAPTVLDVFSGTSRVGHALKAAGCRVVANDHNAYAAALARCYVQADAEDVLDQAERLVGAFNARLRSGWGERGYFTETFCERSRFVQPKNGVRIDAVREEIARLALEPELESVMLVSLMEAADRVDSTTGVQMAYLKGWSPRSHRDVELRVPAVLPRARGGKGLAACLDALEAAETFDADVAYVDPPYNQHSYLGNYHVWESLVRWDKPGVYGVACKREDVKARRSAFNSRRACEAALRRLLEAIRAPVIVVSMSDEGFVSPAEMQAMLQGLWGGGGAVTMTAHDFRRYVGARIGIYNPRGERVGRVSHLRNREYVFVASRVGVGVAAGVCAGT